MWLEAFWCTVAALGLLRSIYLWRESVIDRRALGDVTNGRRLVADWQVEHAWIGTAVYTFLLLPGAIALAHSLGVTSLEQRLFVVPFLMVAALIFLVVQQERAAYHRRRQLGTAGSLLDTLREAIRRFVRKDS